MMMQNPCYLALHASDTLSAYKKALQDHLFSDLDCFLSLFDKKFTKYLNSRLHCLRPTQESMWHHNRAADFHSDAMLRSTNNDMLTLVVHNQIAATTAEYKAAAALRESQRVAASQQRATERRDFVGRTTLPKNLASVAPSSANHVCFRCNRRGHAKINCTATRDVNNNLLPPRKRGPPGPPPPPSATN
eukprot:GHVL01030119.1.p1 GENE.GHVL01030119.1~~GHVL01030119.1.p1  ORF type:complete len:189 (+),score=15.65 GHVL01030119.1:2733-3299(+)